MAALMLSLRRWRPGHLLLAWGAYWVGLALATLGPALPAILRATSGQGSITAGVGDEGVRLVVSEAGRTLWSGTASVSSIALWIAGPPLVLWVVWLARRRAARAEAAPTATAVRELPSPRADHVAIDVAEREQVTRRRDGIE